MKKHTRNIEPNNVQGKEKKLATITVISFVLLFAIVDFITGAIFIPRSYNEFRVRDIQFHHGLRKNVSSTAAWGPILYPIYTNSLGFRDLGVRRVPVHTDQKRILILGDSHSEGVGIDYQFTFAGRLQKIGKSKGIDILNASAVSYSPKIHYIKGKYLIEKLQLKIDEIWVVIDISDLQNEISYEKFDPSEETPLGALFKSFKNFIKHNSFTYSTIAAIKTNRQLESLNNTLKSTSNEADQLPARNTVELYKEFFRHLDNDELLRDPNFHGVTEWLYNDSLRELADVGLNLGMRNIELLNNICKINNINLRLSVHPWQLQILKGDTTDYYVEKWREFCFLQQIHFINLYPLFVTDENRIWITKNLYIEGDNHWNEMGHERVANYLSNYLK